MAAVTTSAWLWLTATTRPTPGVSPSPAVKGPDPDLVTPGVAGFLVVFLLAIATIVLLRSMTGHLRKVRYSPDPAAADAENPEARNGTAGSGTP
jgi:hypothetical protein